jgi:FkbM family methyltransferase
MKKDLQKLSKAGFQMDCLDVGARWGFTEDLMPIAPVVNAIGFEPDKKECDALNKDAKNYSWKSMRYIPVALGTKEKATLNLYKQRGCSSLLEADEKLAKLFSRSDYYIHEGQVEVPCMSLDEAAKKYNFKDASYMKIDIQGAEMDVFVSGKKLLPESIMGIRIETSFIPLYKNQPLFSDMDLYLHGLGFSLMGFIEQQHWRRTTKVKYPRPSRGKIPISRGQLVHGDPLYLRTPESLPNKTEAEKKKILELALISIAYGYVDHAWAALHQTGMTEYVKETYNINADCLLNKASQFLRKKTRIDLLRDIISGAREIIKSF